ncbi:MAG: folylpolyglutamate synthase/dihydrofolate synthase family protein [Acholeplasmataceae bacterium]|nr:folylpolyglutamate synthase/dihydrofolate synthase family protein [Acholeplasmataceae bacterium]
MLNNLNDAIQWIETRIKFRPKTDLERMKKAMLMLDIDLSNIKKIHVAGTNGKGSVCSYITHILMEAGYKVGTYTSPYLLRFNERIRIQMNEITDDELFELILFIYDLNIKFEEKHGETLAFFELLTLMSFIYYSKNQVDVMVMEVGLGGLLDATNVLNYDLSLITSIGFDHMKQLGNTLESIAFNKLGILKEGNHLITTVDPSLHPYFKEYVKHAHATADYYSSQDLKRIQDLPIIFEAFNQTYELSLIGEYQLLNALLSIAGIHYLFPHIQEDVIKRGLKKTTWLGRLEEIAKNVYLDGAHNTHAIDSLKETALHAFKDKDIWVLFSALGDKDITGMIERALSFSNRLIITSFPDSRFHDLKEFAQPPIEYIEDALLALSHLRKEMGSNTVLLIFGSLHFAGYIKQNFKF